MIDGCKLRWEKAGGVFKTLGTSFGFSFEKESYSHFLFNIYICTHANTHIYNNAEEIYWKVSVGGCIYFRYASSSAWGIVIKCWVGGFLSSRIYEVLKTSVPSRFHSPSAAQGERCFSAGCLTTSGFDRDAFAER